MLSLGRKEGETAMKKGLLAALLSLGFAFSAFSSAQKFGVFMDYAGYGYEVGMGSFGIGGYMALNPQLRVGGAIEFATVSLASATGLGVRADYLLGRVNLFDQPFSLDLYYGAQAGANLYFFSDALLTQLNLNGLLGFEYVFPKANLGFFSELVLGPSFAFASGESAFGLMYGGRFGLNFY